MSPDREAWSDFLMRACHDLRGALRAVRTSAEVLLRNRETKDARESEQVFGFLVEGARNAGTLVDGLSGYAAALRVQVGDAPVSLGALLRNALARLEGEIRDGGGEVTYDDLPRVKCDAERIVQLFENLVANAIRHRGDVAPRIHVSSRERDGQWLIAVRDNGPGIAAEDLERIFRPFERLDKKRAGAGLGLAICREIAAGHGGRIWAESAEGEGSTFFFTLDA